MQVRELRHEALTPLHGLLLACLLVARIVVVKISLKSLRRDGKKLTVTDIVNECHITRQTFYYHFEDIPDLLLWMMKRNLKRNMQEASMQSTPEESLKYLITLSLSSRLFVEKAMHAGYREELERLVTQSFNSLIERISRRAARASR